VDIIRAQMERLPVVLYAEHSNAAQDYIALANEILPAKVILCARVGAPPSRNLRGMYAITQRQAVPTRSRQFDAGLYRHAKTRHDARGGLVQGKACSPASDRARRSPTLTGSHAGAPTAQKRLEIIRHRVEESGFTHPKDGRWLMFPALEFEAILALERKAVAQVVLFVMQRTLGVPHPTKVETRTAI